MTKLKIKKLDETAVIPHYATVGAAGMDLTAIGYSFLGNQVLYRTGLAFEIPEGHVGLLFPRSSIYKTDLSLTNCVGVIDSDYRGEVMFRFRYHKPDDGKTYVRGDRIGQLVIVELPKIEIEEVAELTDTTRGVGGFGSTGQ